MGSVKAAGVSDPTVSAGEKSTVPRLPLLKQIKYRVAVFLIQNLILWPANTIRTLRATFFPKGIEPDLVKTYPCRKRLPIRVYWPPSHARTPSAKLPALFVIHGGGFILGDPIDTERWNRTFCDEHNMVVVALNYRKAPAHPFPVPIYDVEALLLSVLADERDLSMIDRDRVALLGWSAGGNFAMAVSQFETVRSHIKAVVPVYPALDFSMGALKKSESLRRKPDLGGYRGQGHDRLVDMAGMFDWCYQPVGHNLRDPLLSPAFAKKEDMPKQILMMAAELDVLAHEAWETICRFAGRRIPSRDELVGVQSVIEPGKLCLDDERYYFDDRKEDGSRYAWLLVPDMVHGFDQSIGGLVRDKELTLDAEAKTAKTISFIGNWLLDGPLKAES